MNLLLKESIHPSTSLPSPPLPPTPPPPPPSKKKKKKKKKKKNEIKISSAEIVVTQSATR